MFENLRRDLDWAKLGVSLGVCYAAGIIGGIFTQMTVNTWYPGLAKPFFTPPRWLFRVVWPVLYTLMGVALYDVWRRGLDRPLVRRGVALFAVQLVLNALWSGAFFTLQSPFLGLIVIVPLWFLIAATIYYFYQVSRRAAWLLAPYLLWVGYAVALNAAIWLLN